MGKIVLGEELQYSSVASESRVSMLCFEAPPLSCPSSVVLKVFKDQLLASLLIFKDRHLKKKLSLPFGFAYSFPWLHSF